MALSSTTTRTLVVAVLACLLGMGPLGAPSVAQVVDEAAPTPGDAGAAYLDDVNASSTASLSAGPYHTCALTPTGAVDCWGGNVHGSGADQPGPYVAVAVGDRHTCALTPAGAADCWGVDTQGQATDQPGPYTAIAAGARHSCALTSTGAAECWGDDGRGRRRTSRVRSPPSGAATPTPAP